MAEEKTISQPVKIDGNLTLGAGKTLTFEGTTNNTYETTVTAGDPTADRTITLPDATDTLVGKATTDTLTNKTLTAPSITDLTEVVAATNVLTAAESGKVCFLNHATEFVSTLPAPAAGLKFTFVVTGAPSSASYTIVTASSANIIKGQVYSSDLDASGNADFETTGGDTITFVDSKAVAGDRVDVICDGTNWFAYGFCSLYDAITITTAG